jgi:ATP-dependent Lon protease
VFTEHFGMVSDFLTECWSQLRNQTRLSALQGRVQFGGALSGRDTNAVNKTIGGLLKLMYPDPASHITEEDLEWAVRLALECRRRVKEQQKRLVSAEFRNTHFSYTLGNSGVEQFVATPELQAENHIGTDPLPPGQVWAIGPGSADEGPGLYRIEVVVGTGSGVRILNRPTPQAFGEGVRYAEQNLYARSRELVGDRDPRGHEFSVQLRAFDAAKSGGQASVATLVALCSGLLGKHLRGGLVIVGGLNLGGSIETLHHAVGLVEHAVEKGATTVLLPVSSRRQLNDLSDEMATKVDVVFYADARDALVKGMVES